MSEPKHYIAMCDDPFFKLRQDEPFNDRQIDIIRFLHTVRYVTTVDIGDYRIYRFDKHVEREKK